MRMIDRSSSSLTRSLEGKKQEREMHRFVSPRAWSEASRRCSCPYGTVAPSIPPGRCSASTVAQARRAPPRRQPNVPTGDEPLPRVPKPKVVFRDERVLVIDKPSGVAIQGELSSLAHRRWLSTLSLLKEEYGELFPVHRLDSSTTGCLILARKSHVARTLSTAFQKHKVVKRYLAVVQFLEDRSGRITDGEEHGTVECRMRNDGPRAAICESGREGAECKDSSTDYSLVTATGSHALVSLSPRTGRKHQLRLHCARLLGAPIVGDTKYDFVVPDGRQGRHVKTFMGQGREERIMLHASEVEFEMFRKEKPKRYIVRAEADVPPEFRTLCEELDLDRTLLDGSPSDDP